MRQNAYCVNHTKYITKRGWKKEISFNVEGKDKSEQSVVAQTQNKHNAYLIRKEPSEKPNGLTYIFDRIPHNTNFILLECYT